MNWKSAFLSFAALAVTTSSFADVGPDFICQDKLNIDIPPPANTIDYWTNIATSWTNTRSGDVEVFVRGVGLVKKRMEITGEKVDQRWLLPAASKFEGQGVYLTFAPSECQSIGEGKGGLYCYRSRATETSTPILAAGQNEKGKKLQYREVPVEARSVQALLTGSQVLVSYVTTAGDRVSLGLACDSQEWYPHIPRDELNRTDL